MISTEVENNAQKENTMVVKHDTRERALEFITEWFQQNVKDYLKISDPYFVVEDLEILALLFSIRPNCRVFVLTSRKAQGTIKNLSEAYRAYWRMRLSGQVRARIEIVIVGTDGSGDSPIHDRWWLTEGSGLRVGTSFNSLGVTKSSEISILSREESANCEAEVDECLNRERQELGEQRLRYELFTL